MSENSQFRFGAATGVGSMPGGDAREAAKTATGTFEDFPFLPELPARGPGADMIGRTAGMLVELYARVEPSGWRLGDRPGRDTKRARSWLGEDLDALEDEPSLTAVLRGQVKSASGYRTHRAVDRQVVEQTLRDLVGVHTSGPVVVHSCAPDVPFALLRRAGAAAVSFDFSLLTERDDETIGEAVEGGTRLFTGVVPSAAGPLSDPAGSVMGVRTLWRRLGLSPGLLAEAVTVTPACGLAGASPGYARTALAHCARAARSLADNPE